MNALRNLILAGTVAVAAALSAGIAIAAPPATQIAAPFFNDDLCRLPYYQLLYRFGRVRAQKIVLRCNA